VRVGRASLRVRILAGGVCREWYGLSERRNAQPHRSKAGEQTADPEAISRHVVLLRLDIFPHATG
jgi:hypothetical protein